MASRSEIEQFVNNTYEERTKGNIDKLLPHFHPIAAFVLPVQRGWVPCQHKLTAARIFAPC